MFDADERGFTVVLFIRNWKLMVRRILMKDLIICIAKALVDNPEGVAVTEIIGAQSSVVELKVAKEDIGKIIGKHGRTIVAMRTILSAASMKLKKRCVLVLLE
jgi:predicted RNA-binding protein YlqC (UPF0109 family)